MRVRRSNLPACAGTGPVQSPEGDNVPQKITREDIQKVIRDLAVAARRAKQDGFDGVAIHSAHGYQLSRFYLPLANHRTDECGPGSIESCVKLHLEVIQAM